MYGRTRQIIHKSAKIIVIKGKPENIFIKLKFKPQIKKVLYYV